MEGRRRLLASHPHVIRRCFCLSLLIARQLNFHGIHLFKSQPPHVGASNCLINSLTNRSEALLLFFFPSRPPVDPLRSQELPIELCSSLVADLPTATAELDGVEFAMRRKQRGREVHADLEREEVTWSRGAGEESPY